ncbi:MAG: hypothetical protein JSV50_08320 [Desulfobacteraceae bacterium]|nr:MAG: hypothetical protein JSV50_08320 [Desulfobacteraceae bacterium]
MIKNEDLIERAKEEAEIALELSDEPGAIYEKIESMEEWNEGIYKNVFEIKFRVWKTVAKMDIEMNADTGEVLPHKNNRGQNE